MKLADIDPRVTEWRDNRSVVVNRAWRFVDMRDWADDTLFVRVVYHYGTRMGEFRSGGFGHDVGWRFVPVSTGWGSVSDQQGMNKIIRGYGWYFRRAGGAAYVNVSGAPLSNV